MRTLSNEAEASVPVGRIDPDIRRLTRDFSAEHMCAVCSIAEGFWYGTEQPWLDPPTIEVAITLAITNVYELRHPEIAMSETIH
jgi:hypothetical protein